MCIRDRAYNMTGERPAGVARHNHYVLEVWIIIWYDSPKLFVWDQTRQIRVTIRHHNIYNRLTPTADTVLDRPLRGFIVVPDGFWRPSELHPEALKSEGAACVVKMLQTSFVTLKRVRDGGRKKSAYVEAMTVANVEAELDGIFDKLVAEGVYTQGEYPFTSDDRLAWRSEGCTSRMVLDFCRKNQLNCHIFHRLSLMHI